MIHIKDLFQSSSETIHAFLKTSRRHIRSRIVKLSKVGGSLGAFTVSLGVVLVWALCGPLFNYSDTWQLVINTGTTIITFLMAFSIQFSQNRDTKQITMILKSLMKQNEDLRDQLAAIEQEMEDDD
ncbi:MAG: low affinity iron permease family protein [Alphaproteobacteria bacterium]|nr:low affinity iron permease family protein [Alphaproteobacteria bacterium]